MVDLATGKTSFAYSGASVSRTIPSTGILAIKIWAGGGGGAFYTTGSATNVPRGGNSGFTIASFNVAPGDVITIEVGQGGRFAVGNGTQNGGNGGLGGWPDGGNGGAKNDSFSDKDLRGAGGGGSTRIYLNGVLIAVCGAGGGGGSNTGSEFGFLTNVRNGAGGGTTGNDSSTGTHGGSSSAGGANDNVSAQSGASLQGGHGYNGTGITNAPSTGTKGGGGGGGYYGGSSGGNAAVNSLGSMLRGAGGSSYINTGHAAYVASSSSTTTGGDTTPAGTGDTDYSAGIGVGGAPNSGNTGNANGGDGKAVLDYTITAVPANTGGDIGTITMTAPTGAGSGQAAATGAIGTITATAPNATVTTGVDVSGAIGTVNLTAPTGQGVVSVETSGDIGTVNLTAPTGEAVVSVDVSGDIGTITISGLDEATVDNSVFINVAIPGPVVIECDLVAGPVVEALIVIDLIDLGVPEISWTDEGDSATGEADFPPDPQELIIGLIVVTPVLGFYHSEDQETSGDIGEITTEAPEGYAAQAVASPDLPIFFTATNEMTAVATGGAEVIKPLDDVVIAGPEAYVTTPDMTVNVALPDQVIVAPVLGVGLAGDDITLAIGEEIPPVTFEPPEATAGGAGHAIGRNEGASENPAESYLVRSVLSAPVAAASGAANKTVPIDLTITFSVPVGLTQRGVNLLAPIGTIFMRRLLGGAGDDPHFEGDALAGADLTPIIITAPDGTYSVEGQAFGLLTPLIVLLTAPLAGGVAGQDFAVALPPAVVVTPPEGDGVEVDPESTADADLTAVVTIYAPDASVGVTAAGALPTIHISPILTVVRVVQILGQAVIQPVILGTALIREVENGVAVVEDRVERTVVIRG